MNISTLHRDLHSRIGWQRSLWLVLALLLGAAPALRAQNPSWQASLAAASTGIGGLTPRGTATDGTGNVYVVGSFSGTVQLGNTTLTSTPAASNQSSTDVFVAKWSADTNEWVWALSGGGRYYDQATNVAVGSGGAVYVSGYIQATATFGSLTVPTTSSLNVFVLKLSDTGSAVVPRWALTAPTSSNYDASIAPSATALAVSGNRVYLAGQFSGPTLQAGSFTLLNAGGTNSTNDAFVAGIVDTGLGGSWQWAQRAGGLGNDNATALAVSGGKVYLAGYFTGTATVGTTVLTSRVASTTDVLVARLSDMGIVEWALRAGGDGDDRAAALVASGNTVYVAGNAASLSPDFAPLQLTSPAGQGVLDLFVARLDDGGTSPTFTWVERAGGASTEHITGLAMGGAGTLYVTGDFLFASNLRFGSTVLANPGTLTDVFVARLNDMGTNGSYAWATQLGSEGSDASAGITADANRVFVGAATVGNLSNLGQPTAQQLLTGGRPNVVLGQLAAGGSWQQAQLGFAGGIFTPVASVADNCGFVYVAGYYSGQVRFGTTQLGSVGAADIVVAKWNPAGSSWTWARSAGGPGSDVATSVAVNNLGQVYVGGEFRNGSNTTTNTDISFGSVTLTHMGSSDRDGFVAKLTDAGSTATFDWACPVASNSDETITALAVGGSSVYLAGYYNGVGVRVGTINLAASQGANDIILARLTDQGSSYRADWARRVGGYDDDRATSLALSSNHLYVAGRYSSTTTASSLPDAFVARFTDNGTTPAAPDWQLNAVGNTLEEATALAVRGNNVYLVGQFFSTSVAFGNITLYNSTLNNNQFSDGFVTGIVDNATSARFAWAQRISGPNLSSEYCSSVAATGQYVYVGGTYYGSTAQFGSLSLAGQSPDGFVARLQEVGATTTFDRAQRVSSPGDDGVLSLSSIGRQVYALATLGSGAADVGTTTLTGPGTVLARLTDSDITLTPLSFTYGSAVLCRTTSALAPILTGTTGGTYSATPAGLTLDPQTGSLNLNTSTPGSYVITYALAGMCGATATQAVTVVNSLSAAFTYSAGPACTGSAGQLLPVLSAGAMAGTFTATPAGLVLDRTTGAVSLAGSQPGSYVVVNTLAASGGCAATSSTTTLVLTAPAVAAFAYRSSYCVGEPTALPTVSGTTGGRFSVTPVSGLLLDAATGAFTLIGSTPGTYTITYAVGTNCPASATQLVTVNAAPATPTITVTGTPATGLTLTASAGATYQFYYNGVPVPGATRATLLINSGQLNGSYTVVVTNASSCVSLPSAPVMVVVTATLAGVARATGLSVYPNPTLAGLVQITLPPAATTLQLLDALGREVRFVFLPASATTATLELNELSAGIYTVRCGSATARLVLE